MTKATTVRSAFSKPIYLGAATRTPIGRFGGSLKHLSAPRLATLCLKEAMRRAPECQLVDAVYLGHARQAGAGPNPARQCSVAAGLGHHVPAITLNQACASGMSAIIQAIDKIVAERAHSIWAGGVESMSNTPYLLPSARWGQKMGHQQLVDAMYQDGFLCPMAQMVMGETVERYIAKERGITRDEQDQFALRSQRRVIGAKKRGLFDREIFEIAPEGKNPGLAFDEHPREDTSLESLQRLPAVFDPQNGTITAGNSSGITDGAAFVHVSDLRMSHHQVEVLDYTVVGIEPERMGLGPIPAIRQLLQKHQLRVEDMHAIEINEAFAAQVLACQKELNIPTEILNPRGGAIALGHPIGASGCRITVTLIHQLTEAPGLLGIASLCVSGGQGVALLLKSL